MIYSFPPVNLTKTFCIGIVIPIQEQEQEQLMTQAQKRVAEVRERVRVLVAQVRAAENAAKLALAEESARTKTLQEAQLCRQVPNLETPNPKLRVRIRL